jgi:hypothetical protein
MMSLSLFPKLQPSKGKAKKPFAERVKLFLKEFQGKKPLVRTYLGAPQKALGELLTQVGIGACVSPATKKHFDSYLFYFLDNGAFGCWIRGEEFDTAPFLSLVEKSLKAQKKADFLVLPDLIGRGKKSLEFSALWAERLDGIEIPFALALQDGVEEEEVEEFVRAYGVRVLFVGGNYEVEVEDGGEVGKAGRKAWNKVPRRKSPFGKKGLSGKDSRGSLNRHHGRFVGGEQV